MRRALLLCTLCVYALTAALANPNATSAFSMGNAGDMQSSISVTYNTDATLPIKNIGCISGLSLDGQTTLNSDTSLVRVLLLDDNNQTYLVYEDFFLTHQDDGFQNIAFETAYLDSIVPIALRIIVRNASLRLSSVNYTIWNASDQPQSRKLRASQQKISQEEYFINKWNEYNIQHNDYWVAGKTSLSNLSYSEKKAALGATDDAFISDGLEYYIGGFFVVRSRGDITEEQTSTQQTQADIKSPYIESFDWRNRHGRNWMTSVKNQTQPQNTTGNGGCWVFGPIAATESAINLQFNQLLDYDLSEQEVGTCAVGSMHSGGSPATALSYIKSKGVVTEECMPFQNADTLDCSIKCKQPDDEIRIADYHYVSSAESNLKKAIINHGPIVSSMANGWYSHCMCLCGYGTIKEGDSIELVPNGTTYRKMVIEKGNKLIGQTYWIYKNSSGPSEHFDGYLYAIYENPNAQTSSYSIEYPITSMVYDSTDVICEDRDGDGYYFWGLGKKPAHCPICCPDIPDGDDSDPTIAQMDEYGNFSPYVFPYEPIKITSDTTWSNNDTICGNITVYPHAPLTISATITLNPLAKIVVQTNASLIVDAGCVLNSHVIVANTGSLILRNGAILQQGENDITDVKKGGKLSIERGKILIP